MARLLLLVLLAAALTAGSASADKVDIDSFTSSSIKTYSYKIINSYPHDPNAFTQGLEYDDGLLYEGTGGTASPAYAGSISRQAGLWT